MEILAVWPDCDFHHKNWGEKEVTSFWIRVANEELEKILAYVDDKESFFDEIERNRHYSKNCFYLLVSKNLESVVTMPVYYPVSGLWNAYNPFYAVESLKIENLSEILVLDESSLIVPETVEMEHYFGHDSTKD